MSRRKTPKTSQKDASRGTVASDANNNKYAAPIGGLRLSQSSACNNAQSIVVCTQYKALILEHQYFTAEMDKDSKDDVTFAKHSDLKLPVTFRMYV